MNVAWLFTKCAPHLLISEAFSKESEITPHWTQVNDNFRNKYNRYDFMLNLRFPIIVFRIEFNLKQIKNVA